MAARATLPPAGGNEQRIGEIDIARIPFESGRRCDELDGVDVVGDEARADMVGLGLHLLHEPRPLDHIGKARVVLDVGGDRELAAGLDARIRIGSSIARAP